MDKREILIAALAILAPIGLRIFPHMRIINESDRQTWEQVRSKGRDRFILRCIFRQGLCFGVTFFVTAFLVSAIASARYDLAIPIMAELSTLSVIVMLGIGAGYASKTWREQENNLQNFTTRSRNESHSGS